MVGKGSMVRYSQIVVLDRGAGHSLPLATSCIKTITVSALIIRAANKNALYILRVIQLSYLICLSYPPDPRLLSAGPLGSRIHGIYLPIHWVGSTAPIRWPIRWGLASVGLPMVSYGTGNTSFSQRLTHPMNVSTVPT